MKIEDSKLFYVFYVLYFLHILYSTTLCLCNVEKTNPIVKEVLVIFKGYKQLCIVIRMVFTCHLL